MIVPYSHSKHLEMVKSWLSFRKMEPPDERLFSPTGYVVDDTAIGFLMFTNSKQVYIDHIVANPEQSKEERNRALDVLLCVLEVKALEAGALLVTVLANLPVMKNRFERMGFIKHGDYGLYYKVPGEK